jgi:xanthine dehydrogenase molybdopterin-binding subunit B
VFAEVRVDRDLGMLRLPRLVSVIDGGRVLNEKTARSQITGAAVTAIGMTMLEETVFDPGTGRIANATFGGYLIPVHADVPDLDVIFVGEPTKISPIGTKGLGEVGTVGCPPPSLTRSTTPPAGASVRWPSPWTNCYSPSRALPYTGRAPVGAGHPGWHKSQQQ